MRKTCWLAVAVALAALGCGRRSDYRSYLFGTWTGTDTVNLTSFNGAGTIAPYAVTVQIGAIGSNELSITGFECPLEAVAIDSYNFSVNATSCGIDDTGNTGCVFTFNYDPTAGGTLSAGIIQYYATGTYTASCTGGSSDSGNFTESSSLR